MRIKESLSVIIEQYPFWESLNEKLIKEELLCSSNNQRAINRGFKPHNTNIVGEKSHCNLSLSPSSQLISQWVDALLKKQYPSGKARNLDTIYYDIKMWFAKYNEGDYTKTHNHVPFSVFSFVYYIKCPKGSSPLVFTSSGKKVKAEEGKLVLFPGSLYHHVPKNKCKDRIVLAGNVLASNQ